MNTRYVMDLLRILLGHLYFYKCHQCTYALPQLTSFLVCFLRVDI